MNAQPVVGPYQSNSNNRSSTVRQRSAANLAQVAICAYCGQSGAPDVGPDGKAWHLDHVMPLAKGGDDATWNVVKACAFCNLKKGAHFQWPIEGAWSGDGGYWNDWYLKLGENHYESCLKESLRTTRLMHCRQAKDEILRDNLLEVNSSAVAAHNVQALPGAQLWWLSEDLAHLIERASATVPEFELTPDHLPDQHGLCFFERPLVAPRLCRVGGQLRAYVSAAFWTVWDTGMMVEFFSKFTPPDLHAPRWLSIAQATWMFGVTQSSPNNVVIPSMIEETTSDLNWLAALWSISAQRRYVDHETVAPNRAERRRAERSNSPISDIKVVRLRATNRPNELGGHAGVVQYSHRFLVRGHWKLQAFGPRGSLRRPIYIDEYVKGPADAPLVVKELVKAVTE